MKAQYETCPECEASFKLLAGAPFPPHKAFKGSGLCVSTGKTVTKAGRANAHLIAAAPAMLKLLAEIASSAQECRIEQGQARCRAAIAKAGRAGTMTHDRSVKTFRRLLDNLTTYKLANPDFRVGQVIAAAAFNLRRDCDPFYLEDGDLADELERMLKGSL